MQALRDIPTSLYELHIFGDSSTSRNGQRYKNRVIKLSKGKSVYFHGFINNGQISDILKEMHVMIHPAIFHEIYGITISEALSLGKPVLSTRCCGPEMQIIDGYNGWLISPNNVKELRAKIIEIICNKSTLPNLSNQCQCPQSLDANISELRKLYNDLAN
jgi:glycosyltransferase involved in cell wall biosynthesis